RTLGKVDEHGNVTEDLRGQILGQLNDRLSYDQLYREALSDPELKRTREELEARTPAAHPVLKPSERIDLMHRHIEPTLQRELSYRGIASPEKGYASELVAWVEVR
ncbi:MAG: hypothetical protein EOM22_11820, partial [Gammaproteobacteria bacterium]|nr:hypothetical protein [Gammaproteobacteria bacterium]